MYPGYGTDHAGAVIGFIPTFDDNKVTKQGKEIHPGTRSAAAAAAVLTASIQTSSAAGPRPAATRIPARPQSTKMDDARRASHWAHSAQTSLALG